MSRSLVAENGRSLVRLGYLLYCRSFVHPHLGGLIKRVLRFQSRLAGRSQFVHDVGGFRMNLDLDQLIDTSIYYMGTWEADSVATIKRCLPVNGTAIDVGANIGFITMHMAKCVGPNGHVIAFEPSSWTFARLRNNLALNEMPHVVVERAALGERESVQADVMSPYGYPLVGDCPAMLDNITTLTLDGYLETHHVDRIDLIKCDTDGWEVKVLNGGAQTLRRFRPALLLEVNPAGLTERGDSVARLIQVIRQLGYGLFHEDSLLPFTDLESATRHLARTEHVIDILALPNAWPEIAEWRGGSPVDVRAS